MPALSPTMKTGKILSWNVEVGQEVGAGDSIASIETDKAVMEYEVQDEGFIAWINQDKLNASLEVGQVCAIMVEDKESIQYFKNYVPGSETSETSAPVQTEEVKETSSGKTQDIQIVSSGSTKLFISPKALKAFVQKGYSKESLSVEINQYLSKSNETSLGSSEYGRIITQDVDSILKKFKETPRDAVSSQPKKTDTGKKDVAKAVIMDTSSEYKEKEMSTMRKVIAERLSQSKREIPHYYLESELKMDALLAFKKQLQESTGVKLSINDFIVKAVAKASKEVEECNSHYIDGKVRIFDNVDVR